MLKSDYIKCMPKAKKSIIPSLNKNNSLKLSLVVATLILIFGLIKILFPVQNSISTNFTSTHGEQLIKTADNKQYFLVWKPEQITNPRRIIISLHGKGSSAQKDFADWYPYLKDRNFEFATLEWWFNDNDTQSSYYSPQALSTQIQAFLEDQQLSPKDLVILHGFSRGALNTYYVAADDKISGKYFDYIIADSGGMNRDFAPSQDIQDGKFGHRPYTDLKFILYCGEKDPEPQTYGCPAMEKTEQSIKQLNGTTVLFIKDKTQGHQGFLQNPDNVNSALDIIR